MSERFPPVDPPIPNPARSVGVKQGTPSTHPILGDELRALRRVQREQEPKSPFVFTSERGAPFTSAGFARMIERAGIEAKFGFKPHHHKTRLRLCSRNRGVVQEFLARMSHKEEPRGKTVAGCRRGHGKAGRVIF